VKMSLGFQRKKLLKIINPSYEILSPIAVGSDNISDSNNEGLKEAFEREARLIELAGRTAYKSEDKITANSYDPFVRKLVMLKHEAVIEFGSMTVKFITDRGISHELVRHRLCSFVQESTRYCNYGKEKFGNECTFIRPSHDYNDAGAWEYACIQAEKVYFDLINDKGWTPQQARSVLPNSLKTEVVMRANFREWRHIFRLRALSRAAHPDMRNLIIPLYRQCRELLPCVFEMGEPE